MKEPFHYNLRKSSVNYLLSRASLMLIVLSLARSVDSLIPYKLAHDFSVIRFPACSIPQLPQDDV